MSLSHEDRIEKGLFDSVKILDEHGDKIRVYNWLTVQTVARVRGDNPVFEQFDNDVKIGAGDSWMQPDAVTPQVARELQDARNIDVRDHDIRVIDPTDEEVDVL